MTVERIRQSGFTLIELVVTMVIIGILAVAAIPRFTGTQDFDRRGFYDETFAALRYAQKSAVAERRSVCVTFTVSGLTLTIAKNPSPATCVIGAPDITTTNLASPTGASPFVVTARPGVAFSATPTSFRFNALGQADTGQTIMIAGFSPQSIIVEQETGYVHP